MRKYLVAAVLVTLSAVLAGCVSSSIKPLDPAPVVQTPPTSSNVPDFSGTSIAPVRGSTTTTILGIRGGGGSIKGRVLAGGAPAGGASVRIERLVGDKSSSVDVSANNDGAYSVDNLVGGRYRVRAFRPPDAAMTQAQVFFMSGTEAKTLDLNLDRFGGGNDLRASIYPDPPIIGTGGTVAITLTSRGVDSSGVARSLGQGGVPLMLVTAGGRSVTSANPVSTDGAGRAQWTIACNSQDNQGMSVMLPDGSSYNVNVSGCTVPPPTTTAAPADPGASADAAPAAVENQGQGNGRRPEQSNGQNRR